MILLLGGTREAVEAAGRLKLLGKKLLVSVTTDLGREALGGLPVEVQAKPLDAGQMASLIKERGVDLVLDCTHPFAVGASRSAIQACRELNIRCVRLERPSIDYEEYPGLLPATGFEEAAGIASETGGAVMLTIGVKALDVFMSRKRPDQRLIARVLPHYESIKRCREAGFATQDIIAAQGPFSVEFNRVMFKEYGVSAVVSKDSGETGGVESKLEAAKQLGIRFVLVKRPPLEYLEVVHTVDELLSRL